MQHSQQIRSRAYQPSVCWKCLARFHSSLVGKHPQRMGGRPTWPKPSKVGTMALGSDRADITGAKKSLNMSHRQRRKLSKTTANSTEFLNNDPSLVPLLNKPEKTGIRQRLQIWEAQNVDLFSPQPNDRAAHGEISNSLTRAQDGEFRLDPGERIDDYDFSTPLFDREELVDVGNRRSFLLPGDLVELLYVGSIQHELAIFVRELDKQAQFYTMSGKWIHRMPRGVQFFVPNFVQSQELDEIRRFLPKSDVAFASLDRLHNFPQSVPRNLGKSLVKKMLEFWSQSEVAYLAAAHRIDDAHRRIADPETFKYATLDEIADGLLPLKTPRMADGKFSKPVLYAVHRGILSHDSAFRAQSCGTLRSGGQYEISSRAEVESVATVPDLVRRYQETEIAIQRKVAVPKSTELHKFAIKTRRLIDHSRKNRQFTTHGTIGPSSIKAASEDQFMTGRDAESFDANDETFIGFLESWAVLSSFSRQSSLNGIGSSILRAIERFEGATLDQSTAWTFLQEIGYISPWEDRVAFELRLPNVCRRIPEADPESLSFRKDTMSHLRKDWGDLPVYCIDGVDAHEIDDGISIDATNVPGEYWIHVHTADPAAHIDPDGEVAKQSALRMETIYMPDRVVPMLPNDWTQTNLSLGPAKPCLTFSARMNVNGDLLDIKITPGIVRKVVFLSPNVLRGIIMGTAQPVKVETVRTVGYDLPPSSPSRPMLEIHQISNEHKSNLLLLHKIGEARAKQLTAKGAISFSTPQASIAVSFHGMPLGGKSNNAYNCQYRGDPTIQLTTEPMADLKSSGSREINTVRFLMLIAGEVSARWCYERGIPIPYRVTPRNPGKQDPAEYFRKTVLPALDADGSASMEIVEKYVDLLGPVIPSTTPGPHVALGVDLIAKCTSPLRRYGDLLLHWQVEAALLEEARLGQSLIGNTREDFLPFTKSRIDALLPHLDTRQRLISAGQRSSTRYWTCNFLVRAWRFKELALPSTFVFLVRNGGTLDHRTVQGVLPAFNIGAQFDRPEWINVEDIKPHDTFEVELKDVNVYYRKVLVKVLRRLDADESRKRNLSFSET